MGIGEGCVIRNAIIDKNACIGDGCVITPDGKADGTNTNLYSVRDGIIVIPKNTVIPSGTTIRVAALVAWDKYRPETGWPKDIPYPGFTECFGTGVLIGGWNHRGVVVDEAGFGVLIGMKGAAVPRIFSGFGSRGKVFPSFIHPKPVSW